MEHENNIYPSLTFQDDIETIKDLKNKLALSRIKDFENDLYYIKDKIKHYKKLEKRWNRIDTAIKYSQIFVSAGIGITGIVLITPVGLVISGITIPVITGAISVLPVIGTMNTSFVKSRKEKYKKLISKLESVKNKLFLFQQKAVHDEILTDEELSISKKMVTEVHDLITGHKKEKNVDLKILVDNQTKIINEMKLKLGI